MSGRSKTRNIKAARRKNEENKYDKPESLTLQDVHCTVCMGIFVEPVTLPCYHTTCKLCFERTIDNNTLACPLCRKYVGGWVRQRQKNGLMVNEALWSYIRQQYDSHVQKKLKGEDDEEIDGLTELNIPTPKISEPGLIRREYEAERKRMEEEALKRQEQEAQASEKLIKELQEKEEEERRNLEELRRKAEEEDALIAQKIAAQLAAEDAKREAEDEESLQRLLEEEQAQSAFVRITPHLPSTPLPPSQPLKKGPMDLFLSQNGLAKTSRTDSSSSTDSFQTEMRHFRPVHYVPTTPPKQSPGGTKNKLSEMCKPVPVMRNLDECSSTSATGPSSSTLRPWLKRDSKSPNENTPVQNVKRDRSPSDMQGKTPKKSRRESPRKNPKPKTVQGKLFSNQKLKSKKTDSDSEADCEREFEHLTGLESTSTSGSLNIETLPTTTSKPLSINGLINRNDNRYRQEQEDYEFALKLQEELNALENQGRSYELRSVGNSPKKPQTKIVTPRNKSKPKTASSSGKKEKRRQCTLEESMNFSVKMEL